jgi:hypothetical protein
MDDIIDLSDLPEDVLVSSGTWGNCKVCGKYQDLRYGVCFTCSDWVKSDDVEAWDVRKPNVRWSVLKH